MTTANSGENRSNGRNNSNNARGKNSYHQKREGSKPGNYTQKGRFNGETGRRKNEGGSEQNKTSRPPRRNNNGGARDYNPYDKDRADEISRRDSRPKGTQTKDSKAKEQQPDKIEIKNRLEKEKKAMQKKQAERKNANKTNRQQSKPKRMGNIDWTKAYENDSYDDDDFDIYL